MSTIDQTRAEQFVAKHLQGATEPALLARALLLQFEAVRADAGGGQNTADLDAAYWPSSKSRTRRCKMVRCKFRCIQTRASVAYIYDAETKQSRQTTVQEATFTVVTDGSQESKKFFASTPSGTLTIGTHEVPSFESGKYYYVDLTEAPE